MRWKCVCSYDGTHFAGWQIQSSQISVQQVIEEALQSLFKSQVTAHGSGRTDAGVHALEQVFHFDYDWRHSGSDLVKALYTKLPKTIKVHSATQVEDDFHARFSAVSKRYHYRLFLGAPDPFQWPFCWSVRESLDLNRIAEAMKALLGEHDFAAFAANRGVEYESTIRTLTAAQVVKDGSQVRLVFEANGFMYKMVRSLAGCLVNVGLNRIGVADVLRLLESAKRTPLVEAAPARGLFLEKVFY